MGQITELARKALETSTSKGFSDNSLDRQLLLIVSEITEAQDELRNGHLPNATYYSESGKPEGFGIELADAIIRILHLVAKEGIDIEALILQKMAYNETRPYKHGKQF